VYSNSEDASMPIPHPLPDPLVELVAQRFRVIGEPMRIRLLDRLRGGEQSVGQLVEATGASQQNVSKHLGVLHQAGIVSRRKVGNRVVYDIADESIFALCETVCGGLAQQVAELAQLLEPAVGATSEPEVTP
jgi:DNA-binding transcriptional ArsR family regulator